MRKKAELGSAMILIAVAALVLASSLTLLKQGGITGLAVAGYPVCYKNPNACIDLNGDGLVNLTDEDIFAQILTGAISCTNYKTLGKSYQYYDICSYSDFNNDGVVNNNIDFQQCFVYFRDDAIDKNQGKVPPCGIEEVTPPLEIPECEFGCADLDGDGFVNDDDFILMLPLFNSSYNETDYPMADMNGDGVIEWEDLFCFNVYYERIVTCNLYVRFDHNNSCPDLINLTTGTGNDGIVNEQDLALFEQHKSNNSLQADLNGDGLVNLRDELILRNYLGKVVDCNIYYAPWHVGGRDKYAREESNTYQSFGGQYKLAQTFMPRYEGQLTKIRFLLGNNSGAHQTINVGIYESNLDSSPNETTLIAQTTINAFGLKNQSRAWFTAYFRNHPVLTKKSYSIILSSPGSSDNAYRWYYSDIINLDNADAEFIGEGDSDDSGISVSSAGDVNNDGYDDILIGANLNDDGGSDAGKTYLIYGPVIGLYNFSKDQYNASFIGENADDLSGYPVSSAGDVNNDGYDDILIGARYNDDGGSDAGKTYLVYGPVSGLYNFSKNQSNASFIGENENDYSGISVSSAGDVNNDGYDDILIGAWGNDDGGSNTGKTYLVYGPVYGDVDLSNADAGFIGENADDQSGYSVSSAGDVNNDGYDDILVSTYLNDDGGNSAGKTYLVYGPVYGEISLSNADAGFIGENVDDQSGVSVSSAGDVNNDGYDDILIGANLNDDGGSDAGKTYLIKGPINGVGGNKWYYNTTASAWQNETQKDLIFETYISSACADLNVDGNVTSEDEDIINDVPEGLTCAMMTKWNDAYDLTGDGYLKSDDVDELEDIIDEYGCGCNYIPVLSGDGNDKNETAGDDDFGREVWISQPFTATSPACSCAYKYLAGVRLYLSANSAAIGRAGPIDVSIYGDGYEFTRWIDNATYWNYCNQTQDPLVCDDWDDVCCNVSVWFVQDSPDVDNLIGNVEFGPINNTSPQWYDIIFDQPLELDIGELYHIVLGTDYYEAYNWGCGTNYSDRNTSISTDRGNSWTQPAGCREFAFQLIAGDPSLDYTDDGDIDSDDIKILQGLIGLWNETDFWLPLVDFNAVYCLFERLRDKTLGWDAYQGKIQTCAYAALAVTDSNRRCDWEFGENYTENPDECVECNYDDFCSNTENFNNCSDCDFWRLVPKADKFSYGSTTQFYNFNSISDLASVQNMILEILPYGKIKWKGPINVTGMDFDRFVDMSYNNISVNVSALPKLDIPAQVTLYNLTLTYPIILIDGAVCPASICTFISYQGNNLTFNVTGFSSYSSRDLAPKVDTFNGSTTDFTRDVSVANIKNVSNVTLEKTKYGKIEFLENINASEADFDNGILMGQRWIYINTTKLPGINNKLARISFYNTTYVYPAPAKNGTKYKNYNFTSYAAGRFTITLRLSKGNFSIIEVAPDRNLFNGSTTNFTRTYDYNIENVSNVVLEKARYGKIEFLERVNASEADFDSHIKMSHTWMSINITALPQLMNKSARLSFYNINFTYPIILKNSSRCRQNCSFVSYQNGIFKVNVRLSSNYSVKEAAPAVETFNGSTTNFSINVLSGDIENASNIILEKTRYGKIVFLNRINASEGDYDNDVDISLNGGSIGGGWVGVNTSADPRLNKSARIYLYNLSLYNPIIRKEDYSACLPPQCKIESYGGYPIVQGQKKCNHSCTLVFNVTRFTKYYAMENTTGPQMVNGPVPNIYIKENSRYGFNLSYYFFDINNDSDTLIYNNTYINPSKVKIEYTNGTVNITTYTTSTGVYFINFSASDESLAAYSNPVAIVVRPNSPPQISQAIPVQAWNEDNNKTINLNNYFSDPDNDKLSFSFVCVVNCTGGNPSNISININQTTGIASFIPSANFNGRRWVKFKASDSQYNVTGSTTELKVNSINDIPYLSGANDLYFQNNQFLDIIMNEDNVTRINLTKYVHDVEDSSKDLNYSLNSTAASFYVNLTDPEDAVFRPAGNWSGSEDFIIKIQDSDGGINYTNNFIIYVTPINDPIYRSNKTFNLTWNEDTVLRINLSDYFIDVDGDVVYFAMPQFGNITVDIIDYLTGEINFTPDTDWFGAKQINLSSTDGSDTKWEIVNLTVINVNDPPVLISPIPNQTWPEDTNKTIDLGSYLYDADFAVDPNADNFSYNYTFVGSSANITIIINQTTGIVRLIPSHNWHGARKIRFDLMDSSSSIVSNDIMLNVTSVNDPPEIINLTPQFTCRDEYFAYQIHVRDPDDTSFMYDFTNYTNMSISTTGALIWNPVTANATNVTVNLTICDSTNCTQDALLIYVTEKSRIINSRIDGSLTNGSFCEIDNIHESLINISTITNSVISFSNIFNSTLTNSNIFNCNISNSNLDSANCTNGVIDPSTIKNSATNSSDIIDSFVSNSIKLNCTVIDSNNSDVYAVKSVESNCNATNSNLFNSVCDESYVRNTNISDANITDGRIYRGTIIMRNGSVYNASASGQEDLINLINYPPVAVINVSKTSAYPGDIIEFNASQSYDPNADSLSYLWEFGDSSNATGVAANHSYSSSGKKYPRLTVADLFNETGTSVKEITVQSLPSKGGGGGGGRGAQGMLYSFVLSTIPVTKTITSRDLIQFNYEGAPHTISILAMYTNDIFLSISSPFINIVVPYNKTVRVDLTQDNIEDIELKIIKISYTTVAVTIRQIEKIIESCYDGIKNQDETDIDCGGRICRKCIDGKRCITDDDCINNCDITAGACYTPPPEIEVQAPLPAGNCYDGIQNQGETGIDCGGPCAPCFVRRPAPEPVGYAWLYIVMAVLIIGGAGGAAAYYFLQMHKRPGIGIHKIPAEKTEDIKNQAKRKMRSYIRETLSKGYSEAQIKGSLRKIGWPDYMIEEVFRELKK